MRVTLCRSTYRTTTTVMRELDDDQQRIIISVPWRQSDRETFAAVADQLTEQEAAAVAEAFGLDRPPEPA